MKRTIRQPLAVMFGFLIVTAAALGGVFLTNPNVTTVDEASDQFVQRGEGAIGVALAAGAVGLAVGAYAYSQFADGPANAEEIAEAEAYETHLNGYQSLVNQKANSQNVVTVMSNYLTDTKPIALMKGKKAYVAEMQHAEESTLGDAKTAAHGATSDYYATKQKNIIAAWNAQFEAFQNVNAATNSTSNLTAVEVYSWSGSHQISSFGTAEVQLVNGSTASVTTVTLNGGEYTLYPGNFPINGGVKAHPPADSGLTDERVLYTMDWEDLWSKIDTQNQNVHSELTTFIDATYDNWQAGEISVKDFADPYLGARMSPSGSEAWSMLSLASMGIAPPENASNVHQMTVTSGNETTRGMLMSDGTPAGGGFSPGETYNADNLEGPQMVLDENGNIREVDGNFTVGNVTRPDGSQVSENETIGYRDVNYSTSNLTELQNLNDQMNEMQAQINARQDRLTNSGGAGWLPDFGNLGIEGLVPIAVIAAGAFVALRE